MSAGVSSRVVTSGSFDALLSREGSRMARFLQEAARHGLLHAAVWTDALAARLEGQAPRYPLAERQYFLQALRWVDSHQVVEDLAGPDQIPPELAREGAVWAVREEEASAGKQAFAIQAGLELLTIREPGDSPFPDVPAGLDVERASPKVLVTGTFDWLHSGHIRFFEEAAGYGALTVVVGHDANIRLLKGAGHPLFPQEERLYMVRCIRYVQQALFSTGRGWLDAEPELERLKPDIYAVNEDGDRPEKRAYCRAHGIEYLVLRRRPKEGLDARSSTELRGY